MIEKREARSWPLSKLTLRLAIILACCSIIGAGPYLNQGMRVAESTMTAIMGRESAYSGMKITWDMIMASQQDLQPKEFDYKKQTEPAPLPVPGVYKFV